MPVADTRYLTPFGEFELQRYPARRDEPLQAWCAADTLLLEHIHALEISGRDVLVVNDEHGALCVALDAAAIWTDSALSALALERNLSRNQRQAIAVVWSTSNPTEAANWPPALVALRVPKQLPLFEFQLSRLAAGLAPGTPVLAAGMDKHLSPRVAALLEQYIGPTERHRGQRKARLFSAVRDERPAILVDDIAGYYCEALGADLFALPNVFSREQLDNGSRLLLAHLDSLGPVQSLLDLACGNGVLGLAAMQRGLCRAVTFADESAMAIESARRNALRLFPDTVARCSFHHGDGLISCPAPPVELILCNPPFHLNHAVDEYAGRRLIAQCGRYLQPGGRLCLVANRHLAYLPTLKRHFKQLDKIADGSQKYIVYLVTK
jgi:23S rRNA (guanine1835-N2)-methyltransferase